MSRSKVGLVVGASMSIEVTSFVLLLVLPLYTEISLHPQMDRTHQPHTLLNRFSPPIPTKGRARARAGCPGRREWFGGVSPPH